MAIVTGLAAGATSSDAPAIHTHRTPDILVIGAGVFGAWTAEHLRRSGRTVAVIDAYGAANSRASSGGESRVIRMGYGADEIYTRWSMRALSLWKEFSSRTGQPLFHETGVLWMARDQDSYESATLATLQRVGVRIEKLSRADLARRYPQISFGPVTWGMLEPESGALMARRAVEALVAELIRQQVPFRIDRVAAPHGARRLDAVQTGRGDRATAGTFVFACGPWLPKIFPALLSDRIYPTRQEVFFIGPPGGDRRFAPPEMPAWIDFGQEFYGIPDLEHRGFKLAPDRHGPPFDPDTGERIVTMESMRLVRRFLAERFPALHDAPIVETRVCQYENTSSGDFLIDRHPDFDNVWLIGGGSGHGFKHGPALGEYAARSIAAGATVEPRFSLATKGRVQKRAVF